MKRDSKEHFRKVLAYRGMWVSNDNLDQFFGLLAGFDAAGDPPVLEGFREWLLATYPACSGPFGFSVLVLQILPKNLKGRESVDHAVVILTRFLDETDAAASST
ncbi:hypothetical protein [Pararhizobium arenae]|uniref:hypothetical protein n=1 Tax=Pararhizobium arenae TaxID=1856850 RepID=UPI000A4DA09F|nr:hypothetical protein [Pararhizobium arenae]